MYGPALAVVAGVVIELLLGRALLTSSYFGTLPPARLVFLCYTTRWIYYAWRWW